MLGLTKNDDEKRLLGLRQLTFHWNLWNLSAPARNIDWNASLAVYHTCF